MNASFTVLKQTTQKLSHLLLQLEANQTFLAHLFQTVCKKFNENIPKFCSLNFLMWITFTVNQRKPINSIQILLLLLWNDFNFWCQYGQYIIQDLRLNLSAQLGKDFTGLVFVLLFDSFLEKNLRTPPWSLFWKNASYDIRLVAQWLALHSKPVFWDGFLLAYTMWCWNSCWVGSALSFPVGYSSNSKKEAPFGSWSEGWLKP